MQNKFFSVFYGINIVMQAIISLVSPAAIMFGFSWFFVNKVGAPSWLYAILIPVGIIIGLVSMVKFAIIAATGLERLEKQNNSKTKTGYNKNEKK